MKKKEYKKKLEKEKISMREFESNNINGNVKKIIYITLGVLLFLFIMFAFTKIKTGEWNFFTSKNQKFYTASMQTTKILCGSILNRDDSEYFVLAYNFKDEDAVIYDSILTKYQSSQKIIPYYTLDLSNDRNNICLSNKLNISNNINELKLTSPVLIKVKDKKVASYYTNISDIKTELYTYVD